MNTDFLHLKRKYYTPISNPKVNKSDAAFSLKQNLSFSDLCIIAENIDNKSKHVFESVFGNPLPSSYDSLGELKNGYIGSTENIIKEINWTLLTIRRYKKEILLFNEYKKEYESVFILGDYNKAEEILDKIENEICYSLWSLTNRFLLNEFSSSPEIHKKFLSEFNKVNKGFFLPTLAYYMSNKSEKNFSVLKYNSDILNQFSKIRGSYAKANKQFYYMYLNFFDETKYSEYSELLAFDSYHSVIDRYLSLTKILKLLHTSDNIGENLKTFVLSKVYYLLKKFDEDNLKSIAVKIDPKNLNIYNNNDYDIKVTDYYISGLYDEAIEELKAKLTKHPNQFEYYRLYVNSFVYSNKKLVLPNNNKCFQNHILDELYKQTLKNINPQISTVNILRFVKNLSNFSICDSIFAYYDEEFSINMRWSTYNKLTTPFNNPRFCDIYESEEQKFRFLDILYNKYRKSVAIDFYKQKHSTEREFFLEKLQLPTHTKQVELAKYFQNKEDYNQACELWENIINNYKLVVPVLEIAIINLFNCYVYIDDFDKALNLYVNSYISNEYIVQKIDCTNIHSKIRLNKFRGISPSIDLPIFYTISNADENEIHRAYEIFNDNLGIELVSEINMNDIDIDDRKITLFLDNTCTTEIFKHSDYINGTKEGLTERIKICRLLQSIDSFNFDKYKFEIDQLTNILIVQEGIQQLDESKIYVNEQGLINTELKDYEGLFTRYKTISSIFRENSNLLLLDVGSGVIASLDKNTDGSQIKSKYSQHPLRDTFKEIFNVITDKFLNSKFGITAYLSTRIRHGVLLGEIRPIFEKLNLIGQLDKVTGQYREINYWNVKYPGSTYTLNVLQYQLSDLSVKVDNLIYNLLKNKLQIQLENENKEGWFNYYFDDITLTLHSVKLRDTKSYQDFIREIIEILWNRTDENLELIRQKIQKEIKDEFNEALSFCSSELRQKLPIYAIPDVFTNITTCSTEVQNTIDRVASWFNRTGSQTSDFDFNKVINIVLENIKRSVRSIDLTLDIDRDVTLKGEFYSHIADMFRIFLDNALVHSIQSVDIISCEINIQIQGNNANIKIKNDYPDPAKVGDLSKQNQQKLNLKKLSSEDNSGMHKALKILKSDLKNEDNEFSIMIDEDGRYCILININVENLTV